MATTKKTAAKETEKEVKTETKKAPAKKSAAKTETAKTTAKKPAAKKTTSKKAAEPKVEMFIEFSGVQVSIDEIIKNVKAVNGKDAKNYTIYVKPEESKAYFVADGEEKEMDVYFC